MRPLTSAFKKIKKWHKPLSTRGVGHGYTWLNCLIFVIRYFKNLLIHQQKNFKMQTDYDNFSRSFLRKCHTIIIFVCTYILTDRQTKFDRPADMVIYRKIALPKIFIWLSWTMSTTSCLFSLKLMLTCLIWLKTAKKSAVWLCKSIETIVHLWPITGRGLKPSTNGRRARPSATNQQVGLVEGEEFWMVYYIRSVFKGFSSKVLFW